jgi:hypothetical protein
MLGKIREIVTAWSIAINPTQEQKRIAEQRLQICNGERVDAYGERFRCEYISDIMGGQICKKCTCPLQGKIFTPHELGGCPENKWTI